MDDTPKCFTSWQEISYMVKHFHTRIVLVDLSILCLPACKSKECRVNYDCEEYTNGFKAYSQQ